MKKYSKNTIRKYLSNEGFPSLNGSFLTEICQFFNIVNILKNGPASKASVQNTLLIFRSRATTWWKWRKHARKLKTRNNRVIDALIPKIDVPKPRNEGIIYFLQTFKYPKKNQSKIHNKKNKNIERDLKAFSESRNHSASNEGSPSLYR